MTAERSEMTLDILLDFVKRTRGFDFTGYKRSTIERRVAKRMGELDIASYDDYVDHLELHPEEFEALFNTILINVTAFFRDAPTWDHLADEVVPQLLASRPPDAAIRVWSAGCASGEEAYTVAMVFAKALGESAFLNRVKIYATDVDEEALDTARHGTYPARAVEDVPREALERFFERSDQRYTFRRDLRRAVIFGRNDLVQDAPISRIDLLVCRNTLMYFNAETQSRILRRFHFALDDAGMLVLGKSEMLITHADLFRPTDIKRRIFHKVVRTTMRDRVRVMATDLANPPTPGAADPLRESAYDLTSAAQVVIARDGTIAMANDRARRMLGLTPKDVGRDFHDLDLSYRPVELRARVERIAEDRQPIAIEGVKWRSPAGHERILDVRMVPVLSDGELLGTAVTYQDATDVMQLEADLTESRRDLAQAHEELHSTVEELETTNEELQSTNEELETTNEELQSTNEELETTNEELQSTNEELETMNEELQSTNEELETMNDELRQRTFELNDVNAFLETILTTIGLSVVVLDRQLHVQLWNGQSRELWGLGSEDVEGRHLLGLDIGLPVDQLRPMLLACLKGDDGGQQMTLDAVNRRGKSIRCKVSCTTLSPLGDGVVTGLILMMEPVPA
jgi:two-component system, chemotaxis family, CheB/CheR fusion protein